MRERLEPTYDDLNFKNTDSVDCSSIFRARLMFEKLFELARLALFPFNRTFLFSNYRVFHVLLNLRALFRLLLPRGRDR